MKRLFSFLLTIIFTIQPLLFAQKYSIKKYNADNGIIEPTVRVLSQDSLGRIWIGTADGLSIYDGNSYVNYSRENGLKNDVINCFMPVSKNKMLVGTLHGGIYEFKKISFGKDTIIKIFNSKKYLPSNSINNIFKDSKNNYWIITDSGIAVWSFVDKKINVKIIDSQHNRYCKNVNTVAEQKDGSLLFGTSSGLISYKSGNFNNISVKPYRTLGVNLIYTDSNKNIWVSTVNGLFFFKKGIIDFSESENKVLPNPVLSILEDKQKNLWIAYEQGLLKYEYNYNKIIRLNQFKDIYCTSLLSDHEGNIWIGNLDGILKIINNNFLFLDNIHVTHGVNKVTVSGKNVIVSAYNGLFYIKNNELEASPLNKQIGYKNIRSILCSNDTTWIGSSNGVYQFNKNNLLKYYSLKNLPKNFVYSLCKNNSGDVFVGTDAGLAVINNNNIHTAVEYSITKNDSSFQFLNKLPLQRVSDLIKDKNNNIWIGYWREGVFVLKNDSLINFSQKYNLKYNWIRGLYEDHEKNIWICTRYGGVYKYDGRGITHFTSSDGLGSNFVSDVIEDINNNYWFGTAKGIAVYNGRSWKQIGASDGITSAGILNITADDENNLYFSCHKGVYTYLTNQSENINYSSPEVFIKNIKLNGKQLKKINLINKNGYIFSYAQNSLQFEFYSSSYKNEIKNKYRYRLKGFDKSWSNFTHRNYITYTHLPFGNYIFQVSTASVDGIQSIKPAEFSFEILPPFWLKWWFIALSSLILISIISGITLLIDKYRVAQILKLERIRTNIATDLHDDIGTNLSRISIFSQLAKREMKNQSDKMFDLLDKIETSSRSLIDKMDDIVWAINPDNDSLEDAILKLENFAVELLEAKGMEVSISLPEDSVKIELPLEIRRQLILIFKEIINNTAKHSKANKVNILIERAAGIEVQSKKGIRIIVKDDGIGFDNTQKYHGNGLTNMKKRSEMISGIFTAASSPGCGTEIKLFIPL